MNSAVDCQATKPLVKATGQNYWSKVQSYWSKLLVKAAGQSYWSKLLAKADQNRRAKASQVAKRPHRHEVAGAAQEVDDLAEERRVVVLDLGAGICLSVSVTVTRSVCLSACLPVAACLPVSPSLPAPASVSLSLSLTRCLCFSPASASHSYSACSRYLSHRKADAAIWCVR